MSIYNPWHFNFGKVWFLVPNYAKVNPLPEEGPTCPECGVRPRAILPASDKSNKVFAGYCTPCKRARDQQRYVEQKAKGIAPKPPKNPICPKCQRRPKQVRASGVVTGYCRECTLSLKRASYAAERGRPAW